MSQLAAENRVHLNTVEQLQKENDKLRSSMENLKELHSDELKYSEDMHKHEMALLSSKLSELGSEIATLKKNEGHDWLQKSIDY